MASKYHVKTNSTAPRFEPVSKNNAIEIEGCLGCIQCVKRDSCVYDVYKNRTFNASQIVDTTDSMCINCMRCVQECKKNILSRTRNPQFDHIGNSYWRADILESIWKQAQTGSVPVSGAGYRGPFAGPGFDEMWTDMSEIVRPTRDGIHGREYISTVIELGRRPQHLKFDSDGKMITALPNFVELPIPLVMDIPTAGFVTERTLKAIRLAGKKLSTLSVASYDQACEVPGSEMAGLIVKFDPATDDISKLKDAKIVELAWCKDIEKKIDAIVSAKAGVIVSVRLNVDENAEQRILDLARGSAGVVHLQFDNNGNGFGQVSDKFATRLLRHLHTRLLDESLRDQITILASGGIAMAEHLAKIIICGADGVGLDTALLAALECRVCSDCDIRSDCPVDIGGVDVEWAVKRIINLVGAWHSQLLEVMGAMGLREVRRLRGECGRAMFFDDLEKESFAPIFGKRTRTLVESLKTNARSNGEMAKDISLEPGFKPARNFVKPCKSRFRNNMGKFKVIRTTACIKCGKCAEVCGYGVHIKAGSRMLAPKSNLCRGSEHCIKAGAYCVDNCPVGALKVGPDPMWKAFGDNRWSADLLASTWIQAQTALPPHEQIETQFGNSGGGFDRIRIKVPAKPAKADFKREDVDLSMPLNRRNDGRPDVTIGVPFYGGGMSFGSISLDTIIARARAYTAMNSFTCSGEGGYPDALKPYDDHVITQVATGLFGVREETIQRVRMVEFKYAQGAKPGLGGHLLGDKVTEVVAKMREAVKGSSLFSPFPFHSVYSVEDHKKHVDWMKHINPKTLVSVKVSGASDVDMVAVGSYYAGAHVVHLDGSYGGTGAAPDIAKKNIAMPIEYAVPKVHRFLTEEGVRDEVTLIASGGLRSVWDIAKAIALGANGVVVGTAEVVALECMRCGVCESGRGCPRGIATTDSTLSTMYDQDWAAQRLINLFNSWALQLQDICWRFGFKSISELVGRSDLLEHLDYDNKPNA